MKTAYLPAVCFSCRPAFADGLPDVGKTPGVSRAGLSKVTICHTKWGIDARHVTQAMKNQVFALQGYSGYDDAPSGPDPNEPRAR
jgi:hypothetical protein